MKRPLLIAAIVYILGILFNEFLGITFVFVLSAAILSCLLAPKIRVLLIYVVVFTCIFLLGGLLAQYRHNSSQLINFAGKTVNVEGTFLDYVKKDKDYCSFLLKVSKVDQNIINSEKIRVNYYGKDPSVQKFYYGDLIKTTLSIELPDGLRNPGGFDYKRYLLAKDIHTIATIKDRIVKIGQGRYNILVKYSLQIKDKIVEVFEKTLPAKEAALFEGVVLGKTDTLDEDLKTDFSNSGLTHIMAVSGMNVAYIVMPLEFIFMRLRLRKSLSVGIIATALIVFTMMTGASASVVRAVIMSLVVLFGKLLNKQADVLTSLAFSSLLILLYNPISLFDIGFQLSYAATLSLIIFYPKMQGVFKFFPKFLQDTIAVTISAQIGVTPIIVYYFNKFSLISLFSNILAVPLAGIILLSGLITAVLGFIHMFLAQLLGGLNYFLLEALIFIAEKSVKIPYSVISISTPKLYSIVLYYCIISAVIFFWKPIKERVNMKALYRAGAAVCVLIVIVILIPKYLEVSFIDVGQGDSIFIKSPSGKVILIDGGATTANGSDMGEKVVTPFLLDKGISKIDIIVMTHTDSDHAGGLKSIIEKMDVKAVAVSDSADFLKEKPLFNAIKSKSVKLIRIKPNSRIEIEGGMYFEALNSDTLITDNDKSLVLRMTYRNKKFLFVGDASQNYERSLLDEKIPITADVLKVSHHGSKYATTDDFLNAVHPKVAVISVGKNNLFGHPSGEVIDRLLKHGSEIFRTDKDGCVTVFSDGNSIEIKTMNGKREKL